LKNFQNGAMTSVPSYTWLKMKILWGIYFWWHHMKIVNHQKCGMPK
jgi:hypothetical protein